MTANIFKAALRNIQRNRVFSFIKISGLSIGMACCILIFLYIQDELSYDTFHENADNIYRIAVKYAPGGQPVKYAVAPGPLAPALACESPEIKTAVRFWRDISLESVTVGHGRTNFYEERFFFADSNVFNVFTFPLKMGDPETALTDPFSLVLTEETARRYFGKENPIGKQLTVNMGKARNFTITGIMENIPSNSHIKFDLLASMSSLGEIQGHHLVNWHHASFYTYLLLHNGYSKETIEKRCPDFLRKHFGENESSRINLFLQPLKDIHLHSHLEDELEINGDIRLVYIFSTIAFIVLLIACINFMNLTIAQSTARAGEIGIRKVLGAIRCQLVWQFLGESFIFAFISLFFAMCIVEVILPGFNMLSGKSLTFEFGGNFFLVMVLAGITLFVGVVSGSYPAILLSSFKTAEILKGRSKSVMTYTVFRKILVVFQFAVSIIFIISTALVYNQLHCIQNMRLGFLKEHVVVMPMREKHMQLNYELLKDELLQDSRIISASASSNIPCGPIISQRREFRPEGLLRQSASMASAPKDKLLAMFCLFVDRDFIETFGIEIVEWSTGERLFARTDSARGTSFILNEAAVRESGWTSPIGKKLSHWIPQTGTVIGVVRDFHFMSLHHEIEPLVLYFSPRWFQYLSIRIKSDDIPDTMEFIEEKWREMFPHSPFEYSFLDEHVGEKYQADSRLGKMLGIFSLLAIFIACTGLFGLTSMTIEQRTKEIGIRKVLGVSVTGIIILLSKEFAKLLFLSNFIAWPVAWWVMKAWQKNFAYHAGISINVFVFSSVLVFILAFITISYQTIKIAITNPVDSLRYE